jgi:hypothetical protein
LLLLIQIFEELDNPNEYYYDEETSQLYYAPNSTAAGPPTGKFEAVVNQTIVKLVGTQEHPVEDVRFEGVTFRDSAYTYMEPHGVPSGGARQQLVGLFSALLRVTVSAIHWVVQAIGGCSAWERFTSKVQKG